MQTIKLLPFKQIKPFKLIGINNQIQFCSIISQNKLLYFSGRNILLENVKSLEQKIIWTNQLDEQPLYIQHICNTHRQNILAVVAKDSTGVYMITIMNINSQINNYQHLDKRQRQKNKQHYLKMIPFNAKIIQMKFILQGALFCIVYKKQDEQNLILQFLSSFSGQSYFNCTINSQKIIVQPLQIFRISYVCIIKNEPDVQIDQTYLNTQNKIPTMKNIVSFNKIQNVHKYRFTLLNATDLHSRSDFFVQVQVGQYIIQTKFLQNHKKTFCFILLSSGQVLISTLSQYGFQNTIRVQVKINRKQHQMKEYQKHISQNFYISRRNNQLINGKPSFIDQQENLNIFGQRNNSRKQFYSSFYKDDPKGQRKKYFMPFSFAITNNSIVFVYQNCSLIGVLTYSILDHQNFKFKYIQDLLKNKEHIKQIKMIKFAEDGCHCCILASVDTSHMIKNQNNYSNEKIVQTTYKQNKNKEFRIKTLDYNLIKKSESMENEKKEQHTQWHQLLHVDFVSGLIQHEHRSDAIQQSFSCKSVNGFVQFTIFNKINNTMFILLTSGVIKYFCLNTDTRDIYQNSSVLNKQQKILNIIGVPQQNIFKANTSSFRPQSVLLWMQKLKNKPFLIISHPIIFQIVLIFHQNIKFYYYNCEKLFQSHHTISIKNCKAGSYSPFGNKLALGVVGAVYIIDSYTHQIIKKIPLVIFPNNVSHLKQQINTNFKRTQSLYATLSTKTLSKIQYLNNQDILMQTGNTTLSILLNYDKVVYYGNTQTIHQNLVFYDSKHKLGIIANESHVKIINKCGINTKNRCQQLAKIELSVSSLKVCGQVDTLFLGGTNGILYMIRWPDFFKSETLKVNLNKIFLFQEAIVSIQVASNYKYLIAISQKGLISINQLIHSDQVQKIGKDVSFVLMKKIQLSLPLINKWFVSLSDDQKRAQTLTKLMGNQAQVKNNFTLLSSEYQTALELKSQKQKLNLQQELKGQIKQYQDDCGIVKLQIQVNFMVDQIKRISGKRQKQILQFKKQLQGELHQIFKQRTNLENQLVKIKQNGQQQVNNLAKSNQNQFKEYKQITKMQINENVLSTQSTISMFERNMQLNKVMDYNIKQDFQEDKQQIDRYFKAQLETLYSKNNALTNQNRNLKLATIDLNDKIRQIIARTYQMETDIAQLFKEKIKIQSEKQKLSGQISQNEKRYHYLIKKTKQYQIQLTLERSLSDSVKLKHTLLNEQIQALIANFRVLQKKRQTIQNQFLFQHEFKKTTNLQLEKIHEKMKIQKIKRKQVFDNSVLIKNHLKLNFPQKQSQSNNDIKDQKGSSISRIKKQNDKDIMDVQKWSKLKQSNKQKMMLYQKRMNQQNKKLIYRFNELKKEQQSLKKYQDLFKIKILQQKEKRLEERAKNCNSNARKQNTQKYSYHLNQVKNKDKNSNQFKSFSIKRSKMVCVSLHQDSNKFITQA